MWDCILSILVIFHLGSEYIHYVIEYFTGRREKNVLADILKHRKRSKKTEKLTRIQEDLDLIKKKLGIETDES